MAWAALPVFSALPFLGLVTDASWWAIVAVTGTLLALLGLATRRAETTLTQAAALLGYFGIAVVALALAPRFGLALAGVALAAHAVWDTVHYRRDVVVSRSLAVWCIGLDLTVGAICLVLALAG
jgi:hypothetical protein